MYNCLNIKALTVIFKIYPSITGFAQFCPIFLYDYPCNAPHHQVYGNYLYHHAAHNTLVICPIPA